MELSFEQAFVEVWRQALVENAESIELGSERFPVRRTPKRGLRQVDFVFEGKEIRGLEQNPQTKSRWAQWARSGEKVMQFLSEGRYVANVAEVTIGKDGTIRVDRMVVAIDCGQVINPDMVAAQMEGGVVFGLTSALYDEITIENGAVRQTNFDNYPMMRITDMPRVEVHIVPSHETPGGIGEPGVPCAAPAVANAIFAATGKRLRRLPFQTSELAQS